ncbi:MAG: FAD:protein FMN transferase [Alcanivoracaceae bacterium]|nr:FAD:protein FMN transferase [Alcanivoracaceae bacterium]
MRHVPRLSLAVMLLMTSATSVAQWASDQWDVMGTRAHVEFWEPDGERATRLIDAVHAEFDRLNALLSPWIPDSDIARINSSTPAAPVTVSAECYRLLETALGYSTLTDGAFDITFAGVGSLYDYRAGVQPDAGTVASALPKISYTSLELLPDDRVRFARDGMKVDLGGIAKGYAIDRAIQLLRQAGIEHAWVSLGGDSYVLGDRRGRLWQVGIRHPRDETDVAITLPAEDVAISTSGDYERYFMAGGERVHHILNPATGRPAGELASVTIIAAEGIQADALSTSVFILGVEKGLTLVNALDDVSAIIIDRQGNVSYSDDLLPGA